MNKAYAKLKQKWEEDPMQVLLVGALVATAAAKLWEARTHAVSQRTWDKEVSRRIMQSK